MSFINVEIKKIALSGKKPDKSLASALAQKMELHVQETFDQEGPGWTPLKAKTRRQRVAQGFGEGPILDRKRTGRVGLRENIVTNYNDEQVVTGVTSNIAYAKIHQFGGRIVRVTQPGTVKLRTDRKGNLIRQADYKNLAVFKGKNHKLVKEVKKSFGKRYSIYIPKRKYLFFTDKLIDNLKRTVTDFINK